MQCTMLIAFPTPLKKRLKNSRLVSTSVQSRGSERARITPPAHMLTHPAPPPVRPTLQLTVGSTGEACSTWKRPRPGSPGSASTDTNADPVTSRYDKRPKPAMPATTQATASPPVTTTASTSTSKNLITNYFGKRPEPAAASPPATTAAAAAAVAAVRSPPPEWSERGPLLGPDDALLATLELHEFTAQQHQHRYYMCTKPHTTPLQHHCVVCDCSLF